MSQSKLTADQLSALATLSRVRPGPSLDAARLVLVDGVSGVEAARQTGMTPTGVSSAVGRLRRALVLARTAAGASQDGA